MGMATASIACGGGAMSGGGAKQPMGTLTVSHLNNPADAPEEAKTIQVSYAFNHDLLNKDFSKTYKDGFDKSGVKVDQLVVTKSHFDVKDAKIVGTVTYVKKGFGHYSIVEANLVATGRYNADVQVDVDVTAKGDTKNSQRELAGTILGGKPIPIVRNMAPTNIPIAGPLFLHAHFDLTAACEMGVEGQMHATTGVGVTGDVRLAANYKKAGFDRADGGKKSKFAFEAKTPNFELSPKPYVKVEGKQQNVHGKCSLQPTTVVLMEKMIGAKLSVEPYVEMSAQRPNSKSKWQLDAQAGVSVSAATDIQFMGRQIGKPKEFNLFDLALTKKGDALAAAPARAKTTTVDTVVEQAPSDAPTNVIAPENLPPSSEEEPAKAVATSDAKPEPKVEGKVDLKPETVAANVAPVTPVAATPSEPTVAAPIDGKAVMAAAPKDDAKPANDILGDALHPEPTKADKPAKRAAARKQPTATTKTPKKKAPKKKAADAA